MNPPPPPSRPAPQVQNLSVCGACVVCHCHQVTEAAVRQAIHAVDARSIPEITLQTRAGSSCGSCHCRLERMLAGLPPNCGRFALCGQCGCVAALCACAAA